MLNEAPEYGAGWYFTAPWDPVLVRRGDALGLRAGADYFADLLAPGLSNGTSDARWISLLSWCLKWSHIVWREAGGGDLSTRDGQRARYAWLRPLELLWIDRTLEAGQTTGQLRGRRSVERWRKDDRNEREFAMSPDQFRRYRQVGSYGAYRVMLRALPGLTTGDGWTPAATAHRLADLANQSLPPEARLRHEHFENATRWGHWLGDESRYWTKHGWPNWASRPETGWLPTPNEAIAQPLPDAERILLEGALFANESRRRVTATVLAQARGATSHPALCEAIAASATLARHVEPASLAPLPAFTRFADAAMHTMRGLWDDLNSSQITQTPPVQDLAKSTEIRTRLETMRESADTWLSESGRSTFPHDQVITQLAEGVRAASAPVQQLRAMIRHHLEHGGGRRWFTEQEGRLKPLVAHTGIAASDYRFRLYSLSCLAGQCGVAPMDDILDAISWNGIGDPLARDMIEMEEDL